MAITLHFATYNRLGTVVRCLKSFAWTLTRPDVRWIIDDDASHDGVAAWLYQFSQYQDKVSLNLSSANQNYAIYRQQALERTRAAAEPGDVLIFLDSDVICHDYNFLDMAQEALAWPGVGLVGHHGWLARPSDWWKDPAPPVTGPVDCVSGYCQAFRLDRAADWNIDLDYGRGASEDDDFCAQVWASGQQVFQLPHVGITHAYAGTWDIGKQHIADARARYRRKWEGRGVVAFERGQA